MAMPEQLIHSSEDLDLDQRIRLELAYVYAILHSGGPVETEKTYDVSAFVHKLAPVIKDGASIPRP